MFYTSTRDNSVKVTAAQAITQGISEDGGLFVPQSIPQVTMDTILSMQKMDYIARAKAILGLYLTDFTEKELAHCVEGAYRADKFSSPKTAPVVSLHDNAHVLELWHGPTCAFKDMALQLLPYLMTVAARKTAEDKTIVILVATSGDTGKAALEGFKDVERTKILVFYPNEGVSPMQQLQMATQEGENVAVCAIEGNFDDAQSAVKAIFTDKTVAEKLAEKNMMFSSANSINWGRLAPQIVYYFSAYCDLLEQGALQPGEPMNVVVPTGNFGNILAAYYAMKMGLPIRRMVCASNSNNVLTDFLQTGVYDRNRAFYTTTSPSMDILISSNLERLLYHMTDGDANQVRAWMNQLSMDGKYKVYGQVLETIQSLFDAGYCDEKHVESTIHDLFETYHYLCDTHTAVAVAVYEAYVECTGEDITTVIDSTASPYKFSASVLRALQKEQSVPTDEFEIVEELHRVSDLAVPAPLAGLKEKQVRFSHLCQKADMADMVFALLKL